MFKVSEILIATEGKLINGSAHTDIGALSIDSRTLKRGDTFVAIKGNNFDGHSFIGEAVQKGAVCIIKEGRWLDGVYPPASRGDHHRRRRGEIPVIDVKDTIKALGDIGRYQRRKINKPVVAVTGSAGKTTVKEMLAWILSKRFNVLYNEGTKNNHIGLPLSLTTMHGMHEIAVLELGTNHPGEIEYLARICEPNIGVITNIGPAHLEYFKTIDGVFREKYALIDNLNIPGIAVLNADDALLRKKIMKKLKKPAIFSFGIKNYSDFQASDIGYRCGKLRFYVNSKNKEYECALKTLGYNNIYNALAATAVSRIFGMEYQDIFRRLSTFNFPKSRLNLVTLNNVRFIDDTYNSNPLSLGAALNVLEGIRVKGRKIFVMGDMLELGAFKKLYHFEAGKEAGKICDTFVTVGKLAKFASRAAKSFGLGVKNIFPCESSQEARDILFNTISPKKEDIVLVKGSRGMKMEEILKIK